METEKRLDLVGRVAAWYYEDNLSQEEIAERIGRSRSMVSRILQQAHEIGLVEIRVHYPLKRNVQLEAQLCEIFGLKEARVLAEPPADYHLLLKPLGELGAQFLQSRLSHGLRIGISWGTAVFHVVQSMARAPFQDVQIIQIIGAIGAGDPNVDGIELARALADKLDANYNSLCAPQIVQSSELARGLLQNRAIAQVLSQAARVDVALMGIGVLDPPEMAALWRAGYLSEPDLIDLTEMGVVAEILSRPLDIEGTPIDCWLTQRTIGLSLDALHEIPTVMAVAGGLVKGRAILSALRSGLFDVLVTDAEAATYVISNQQTSREV